MAQDIGQTRYGEELGKAITDRLGLNPNTTLKEWRAEGSAGTVWVTMTTMKGLPEAEFNELLAIAAQRAAQPAPEPSAPLPTPTILGETK